MGKMQQAHQISMARQNVYPLPLDGLFNVQALMVSSLPCASNRRSFVCNDKFGHDLSG